nr:reverse transcriptase domain-containing protein [Tanacetum cinerariifolium]
MPLSIWKKLSLPELTPTWMTLELADRSITRPKGVAEDVFVKVRKFHFPTDFIVVDFEADLRVPLILGSSFLRTGRALIDVYGEEITLRVNDESITFNLNQTMRYSSTYDDTSVNRVDVIDVTCEEFVQDVLDFQYNPKSSNPTLVSDDLIFENDSCKVPIVKSSSLTLTPFGESDFILEEIEDFLNDDSIPYEIDDSVFYPKGDIRLIEKLLNVDPYSLPPMDLKLAEESKEKYFIEEPPKLELKDLPSHLEYAFLEDSNKLPVIIAKNLKVDEREALLNVLNAESKEDEQNTEEILDKEHSNSSGSTAQVQPPVVPISILKLDVSRTQSKPSIPYLSRLNDQKLREKATNQMEKFFQIFHDLHFDISFADALLLMPKFASTIKSLLANKDKLFELAKVPLNENCLAMLLKKLPEKLGDLGEFLFPCDFLGMEICHALADLGASINLMPLSIWIKLSLPELTPTRITLELADRSITRPKGVAEDVFVKVPIVKSSSLTLTPFGESVHS